MDESPEDDKNIVVDGLAVLWEEVLKFVGSKVCLDRNARYAIAHRSAQANWCLASWRPVLSSSWLPRRLRLNTVEPTMWQAFSLELARVDDGKGTKRQNCELEYENGGKRGWREEATMNGNGPMVGTLAQDRSPLDREVQHEWRQVGWSASTTMQNLQMGRRKSPSLLEVQMALRNQSNCLQVGCSLLRIVGNGDGLQKMDKPSFIRGLHDEIHFE